MEIKEKLAQTQTSTQALLRNPKGNCCKCDVGRRGFSFTLPSLFFDRSVVSVLFLMDHEVLFFFFFCRGHFSEDRMSCDRLRLCLSNVM